MAGYLDKDGAGIIAEKINELNKKTESKYTLPSDGIPETDLSQEVQDKLNSGGGQTYDTIISTQEEFEAWYAELDARTYAGSSVLILGGTYRRSDGKGLHLPDTLKQLHGLGEVKIILYGATGTRGIFYDTLPIGKEYSIKNIYLSCSGDTLNLNSISGFEKCTNINNCTCKATGGYRTGSQMAITKGFINCSNLINCKAETSSLGTSSDDIESTGFYNCNNLIGCESNSSGYNYGCAFDNCKDLTMCVGVGSSTYNCYGFYSCTNLAGCNGSSMGPSQYGTKNTHAFNSCTHLVNCIGTATSEATTRPPVACAFYNCTELINCMGSATSQQTAFTFSLCNICSNCRQDPDKLSTTSTWNNSYGANCTNVDPDTCPEWVDTRPFPPTPTSSDNGKLLGVTDSKLQYVESIRPTYFKLNGTPMTDTGGVGTKYTIATSNLTPSTPTPVVGDTVVFYTDSYTYIGSVTAVQASAIVAEVKVTMLGAAGGGGGGTQIYDTVISSQDDFDAWCKELDAGTYAGHSVVLLHGTYTRSDGKGLHLPPTLYTLHGIGNVTIQVDHTVGSWEGFIYDADTNPAVIWYTSTPANSTTSSIKNINVVCVSKRGTMAAGFYHCRNIENCTANVSSYDGYENDTTALGFNECYELTNCYAYCKGLVRMGGATANNVYGRGCGFLLCGILYNCYASTDSMYDDFSVINIGFGVAFASCSSLVGCSGVAPSKPLWNADKIPSPSMVFYRCSKMVNCEGSCNGNAGIVYSNCVTCSNCRIYDGSKHEIGWEGGVYISKDTCPEYTG